MKSSKNIYFQTIQFCCDYCHISAAEWGIIVPYYDEQDCMAQICGDKCKPMVNVNGGHVHQLIQDFTHSKPIVCLLNVPPPARQSKINISPRLLNVM